ncbi:cardiolipin synthase [Galbitalea sp. SE-J8]|uniref:cardiolipin synthase n=1 Tax=Galbitalea sp. SE-J8 TaxID=3054952 RepID=UPI00259CCF77|nr:cardiolipin synthase [Galbitalea sp. SE-J8]MDM4763294.1 cardiolipin synthase [Galbitalea sp. SE-J8]
MIVQIVAWALIAVDFCVRVVSLVVVPRNRRPQTALAWLLAINFLPYLGILLFLLLGSARLPRRRRQRQATVDALIRRATEGLADDSAEEWPSWFRTSVALSRALGAIPLASGNAGTVWADDARALDAMVRAIDGAARTVNAEFYILLLDDTSAPFFDALERAHRRGVTVRVMLDHLGNRRYPGWGRTIRRLEAMGVQWHLMLPFQPLRGKIQRPDLRNHRKLLVVDGAVAFTGSRNIVDPGYQTGKNARRHLRWHDFMVEFRGPVVAALDVLFVTDWYCETDELIDTTPSIESIERVGTLDCQVVPSGPGFDGENNLRLFLALVHSAQHRIVITSPYFVPDDAMLYAITTAAESGVEVELFVSAIGDQWAVFHAQRSYYEALLTAGVRIRLYEAPVVLHSKHFTVDDEIAVIGSSNMDMRSFTLDLELSVMVRGEAFLAQMRAVQEDYRAHSRELTVEEWNARGRWATAVDNIARLTSVLQ